MAQKRVWYQVHDEPLSPTRNLLPDYETHSYNLYIYIFIIIYLFLRFFFMAVIDNKLQGLEHSKGKP